MNSSFAGVRAKALILSQDWEVCSDIIEYLPEFGIPFIIAKDFHEIPYDFLRDYQTSYIFVSVDDFGGPIVVYDQLRKLRENMPHSAVILVSNEFTTDEYGTHRLTLADVSIRSPLSKSSLLLALQQAPVNLSVWSQRIASVPHSLNEVSAN